MLINYMPLNMMTASKIVFVYEFNILTNNLIEFFIYFGNDVNDL